MRSADSDRAWLVVRDRRRAGILTDPVWLKFLEPFIGRERSVTAAAAELGVGPNSLLYRVGVLVSARLLRVARVQRRAGRPIKHYRSTADGFFIPRELHLAADLTEQFKVSDGPFNDLLADAVVRALTSGAATFGTRIYRDHSGALNRNAAPDPDTDWDPLDPSGPAALSHWSEVRLDFPEAKRFQRELLELLGRYRGRRGGQRYLVRLGLAPVPSGRLGA